MARLTLDRAGKQKLAIQAIRDAGGWVYYDFEYERLPPMGGNNLKSLGIQEIDASPEAAEKLIQALPGCKVHYSQNTTTD